MNYAALIRGINVGGNNTVSMAELKSVLAKSGFENLQSYINSGNIFFTSKKSDERVLEKIVEDSISKNFHVSARVVVISHDHIKRILDSAPKGWGQKSDWKYNTLFLLPPYDEDEIIKTIGTLKPDIEVLGKGEGVIWQAVEFKSFGKSTTGKLAASPVYKSMTVRNYNTTKKIGTILDSML